MKTLNGPTVCRITILQPVPIIMLSDMMHMLCEQLVQSRYMRAEQPWVKPFHPQCQTCVCKMIKTVNRKCRSNEQYLLRNGCWAVLISLRLHTCIHTNTHTQPQVLTRWWVPLRAFRCMVYIVISTGAFIQSFFPVRRQIGRTRCQNTV